MAHKLERMRYQLLIGSPDEQGSDVELEVIVIHGDQIRGSQLAHARKLPPLDVAPLEHASLWVYAACKRLGHTDKPYSEWVETVLDLQSDKGNGQPDLVTVDPTSAPSV